QRDVRTLEQLLGVLAVTREDGDADARLQLQHEPVNLERLLQRTSNSLRDKQGARAVVRAQKNERELVAAEARHSVGGARNAPKAFGEMLEHRIPRLMTERVVDLLEAIEVEQHQRESRAAALRREERLLEPIVEEPAVC